jgi:hypothetical protein
MRRIETYERRASFWLMVYFTTFTAIIPVIGTAAVGFMTANALLAVGSSVLIVFLYFAASNAAQRSIYWADRADAENQFETIETLSSPRWHADDK